MARLIYSMMVSADGFVESTSRDLDWVLIDEELHTYVNDQQAAIGTWLYGRRMYQLMAEFWPTADADPSSPACIVEFARIWKSMPKIVFSKTMEKVEWNSRLSRDEVGRVVRELKARSDKDFCIGGATLAADAVRQGLVDEYQLFVQPALLGGGTPMFPQSSERRALRLIESRAFASGVVLLRLQPAGDRT